MRIFDHKGKKTVVINVFIDPENGFLKLGLTDDEGGVLYVPKGEQVSPIMGRIISGARGGIFVIGQDYHPRNHISFMVNHPGVMEYRIEKFKELLTQSGQEIPDDEEDLYKQAQQPVHFFNGLDQPPVEFPFPEIVLDEDYNIMGLKEADGRIREVRAPTLSGRKPGPKDRGRVARVLDEYHHKTYDEYRKEGRSLRTQTLWTMHCVQGTKSCLYPPDMRLPKELQKKLLDDLKSDVISYRDPATDNEYYVIRKGANPEVDSYGIGVENDGKTLTAAWDLFAEISEELRRAGCEQVVFNCGGLATNFCTEFSINNIVDFLSAHFKNKGMLVETNFVPEISRGIPIPGGVETPFSLAGTEERLRIHHGVGTISVAQILKMGAPSVQTSARIQFPIPAGM